MILREQLRLKLYTLHYKPMLGVCWFGEFQRGRRGRLRCDYVSSLWTLRSARAWLPLLVQTSSSSLSSLSERFRQRWPSVWSSGIYQLLHHRPLRAIRQHLSYSISPNTSRVSNRSRVYNDKYHSANGVGRRTLVLCVIRDVLQYVPVRNCGVRKFKKWKSYT